MIEPIPTLLRTAARRFGHKPYLGSNSDGTVSFAEVDAMADRFAKALLADGLKEGEYVGIWAPNMWEWIAAAVGTQRVGGAIVPLNSRLSAAEVAEIARRARITRLVSIGTFLGRYFPEPLRKEPLPDLKRIIVLRENPARLAGIEEAWDAFLARGRDVSMEAVERRAAAVTLSTISDLMFTSGTTGRPKGALFDHRRSVEGAYYFARTVGLRESDRLCCFGPFSHVGGYKNAWVPALMTGMTVYWPDSYDSVTVLNLISDHKITFMPSPPTVWQDILGNPDYRDWDVSSLRCISSGGTRIPPELIRRLWAEIKPEEIHSGYGMTESCGLVTYTRPGDSVERIANTAGCVNEGLKIKLVDRELKAVPVGTQGEILVRGGRLLLGYVDDDLKPAPALDAEGWFRTGDVGVLDEDGYLTVTDRLKDMFIVGGFNVYPAEIERKIDSLPGVSKCAIVGVPDQRLGEVGHAFVIRSPGSTLTENEIISWCKANLASFKVPRGVTFVDSFPLNSTNKILKFELKRLVS